MGRIELWSELSTSFFSLKSERPYRQLDGIQLIAMLDWAASRCPHHDEVCQSMLPIQPKSNKINWEALILKVESDNVFSLFVQLLNYRVKAIVKSFVIQTRNIQDFFNILQWISEGNRIPAPLHVISPQEMRKSNLVAAYYQDDPALDYRNPHKFCLFTYENSEILSCLVVLAKEATNLAKFPTSFKDEVPFEHILTAATAFRNLQVLSADLPHLQYVGVQNDVISLAAAAAFVQQCASLVGFRSRRVRWSRRPPPPLPTFHAPLLRGPSLYSSLPQLPPWRYPAPRISLDASQQQASMVGAAVLASVMPAPLRSLRLLSVVGQQNNICGEPLELLPLLSPQQRSQLQELEVWAGWPWASVAALLQGCPHLVHLRVRCTQRSPPDWDAVFEALQRCPRITQLTFVDLADTDDLNGLWERLLQLEQLDYLDFRRSSDEHAVSSETPLDVRELLTGLARLCAERGHVWRYLGLAGSELVDEELLVRAIEAGLLVRRVSLLSERRVPWVVGYGQSCLTAAQVRAAPRPQEPEVQLWVPRHIGEEDEMRGEADLDWLSDNDDDGR
eukprot:gene26084-31497_t